MATDPGHFDPLGVDTITLSSEAAAIPELILAGGADAICGTQRPYAYFRKYFDQGAPWTFVVQNQTPHCCIINAKALAFQWLDAGRARTPDASATSGRANRCAGHQ